MPHSPGFPVLIKRILLFFAVIAAAVLQNTDGLLPVFFGARLFPLIPVAVCIGMCEGELSGLFYGAAAGAFWDVCSGGLEGFNAFYLALAGCVSGILIRFFMRNRLLTQYCLCTVAVVLHSVIYWLFTVYIPLGDAGYGQLLGFYLPSAVLTVFFSFITYIFVKLLSNTLKEKKTI